MEQNLLNFLTSDNILRNQALSAVEQQCSTRPDDFAKSLCTFLVSASPYPDPALEVQRLQLREISSLVLHKNLLSKDQHFTKISQATLSQISESVFSMVDSAAQTMNWGLLKRSAEILAEIAVKCDHLQPFFQKIKGFALDVFANRKGQPGFVKQAKFGLYCLELVCEYQTEATLVQQNAGDFLVVFEACFACADKDVKSFGSSAVCMFLVSQVHENLGNNLQGILEALVEILIDAVKGKRVESS